MPLEHDLPRFGPSFYERTTAHLRKANQPPHFRICAVERTSGLKATGHNVDWGGMVLPLHQELQGNVA
ncbi:hypothetical protein PF011_g13127 [Phytophthora fragariae]|uniref:Uncharacterized protein n=1 Tax=Phytophthora fragariae TaxID=53985 RepID=A0A6A3KBB2_9STRA|nr:hypothetical protein PF011_g13127 [Phytophthora fragariae]